MNFYQVAVTFCVLSTITAAAMLGLCRFTGKTEVPWLMVIAYIVAAMLCSVRVWVGRPDFKAELRSVVQAAIAKAKK